MVMFFELTNSLATFWTMMNDLLRNIIETEDVAVVINNIMVRAETEEGHDNIIEEMLRRMVENNLFVKPENCM